MAHFFQLENPEMAQNSNRFCLESIFSSNFELKKVSHLKVLTRDGYFELKFKKN